MKKVSFVADKVFHGNTIFDKNQTKLEVGSFDKYHKLYDEFKKYGYEIATDDINTPQESDIVLYLELPKILPKIEDSQRSYLLAVESVIIRPESFNVNKHKYFNKIFTWNDALVDNKKYIKINYSFKFPNEIYKIINRDKLCTLIVSNKKSNFPNELYSERKELIRWFEKNYPEDFDLYGFGWNEYRFTGSKIIRVLNKIPFLKTIAYKLFGEKYSIYKGKVNSKQETMKNYKFAIAYENVKDEMGYITEKIFDVIMAGCVPIYWGSKNIMNYVPKNCFIDRRDFKSNEDLYEYLISIDEKVYIDYLDNIEKYLNSEQAKQFSTENFAKIIVEDCINKRRK